MYKITDKISQNSTLVDLESPFRPLSCCSLSDMAWYVASHGKSVETHLQPLCLASDQKQPQKICPNLQAQITPCSVGQTISSSCWLSHWKWAADHPHLSSYNTRREVEMQAKTSCFCWLVRFHCRMTGCRGIPWRGRKYHIQINWTRHSIMTRMTEINIILLQKRKKKEKRISIFF